MLPSFTCLACPTGSSPLTHYECQCPINSVWHYANKTCVQCTSSAFTNSLPSGGTNFACLCSTGYMWDVMTQTCILSSTCSTASTSCMKCPSGTASTLNKASAHNLTEGVVVQNLLNGTFTNYNLIKGYQCSCSAGYSWDSYRLRCYTTGLL
jgi:hypothetical protein